MRQFGTLFQFLAGVLAALAILYIWRAPSLGPDLVLGGMTIGAVIFAVLAVTATVARGGSVRRRGGMLALVLIVLGVALMAAALMMGSAEGAPPGPVPTPYPTVLSTPVTAERFQIFIPMLEVNQ